MYRTTQTQHSRVDPLTTRPWMTLIWAVATKGKGRYLEAELWSRRRDLSWTWSEPTDLSGIGKILPTPTLARIPHPSTDDDWPNGSSRKH